MTTQTSTALVPIADPRATKASRGCCGTCQESGRMKTLMVAAAALLVIGFVAGSTGVGVAATALLLYIFTFFRASPYVSYAS